MLQKTLVGVPMGMPTGLTCVREYVHQRKHLQLTTPVHIPMERQRKLKDVTSRRQSKMMDHPTSSLAFGTLTRATVTILKD